MDVDAAEHFRGFNFEFLADAAGNYNIQLTVTDEAGQSDSDTITIAIPASTRINYYVDVNGSDTSGDGSQSRPWATVHQALTMLDDTPNWKLNLKAGQEHMFQPEVRPFSLSNCTNIEIGRYGTGTDPIVHSHTVLRFGTGTENYYVHNLRMRSSEAITDDVDIDHAFAMTGNHGVFSDIVVEGSLTGNGFRVAFALDTGSGVASHVCLLRCTTQATRYYSIVNGPGNPRNISCIGCSFGPSLTESCVRFLEGTVDRTAFFCCDADTSDSSSTMKATIRFQWAKWGSCYRCRLLGGDCKIGQVEVDDGVFLGFAEHVRIDACRLRGTSALPAVELSNNVDGCAIVNNYIELSEAVSAMSVLGLKEGTRRCLIAHNTFDNVMGGKAINEFSDEENVFMTLKNNLFIMENFTVLDFRYFNRQRADFGGDLAAWTISHNVWTPPSPTPPPPEPPEVWQVGTNLYDLAGWNGLPQVSNETTAIITLDSNLRPLVPTVVPKIPGVFEDYYGNPRTVVWAGAVGPAPP